MLALLLFLICLSYVYHIPKLTLNLAYVGQLCDFGNLDTFSSSCVHDMESQKLIGTDQRKGVFYVLDELKVLAIAIAGVDLSYFRLSPFSYSFYL